MLRAAGRGALTGLAWGLLARLFMRLLATTPEFTWDGTLAILGLSTLLGTGLGLVVGARQSGRSRWWRLAPVPGLVLFMSPGMVMVPGGVLVALALAARSRVATLLLLVAALAAVVVPAVVLDDGEGAEASPLASLGLAFVITAVGLLGAGFHEWWRRWAPATPHTPAWVRSETRV